MYGAYQLQSSVAFSQTTLARHTKTRSFGEDGHCTDQSSQPSKAQLKPELYEGDAMSNLRGAYSRKFRGSDRRMFRNVDTAQLCRETLLASYGDEKSVHKSIAEDTGMSPAAAENWTAGENPMSLTAFLNAYHNNSTFKAWARKLLLMEQDLDPEFEAEMHRFMQVCAKRAEMAR